MREPLIAALFAVTASVAARAQCPDGTPPPCHVARGTPAMSVAVLDFVNLSRDSADAYISQALADELSTRLGQVARLTVASRTAVRRLPSAATMPVSAIGRALNAAYLVNGSYSRAGARLRFNVELLRVATSAAVWSSQYDRSDQDLLSLQEAVATAVATAVAGRLLPAERTTLASRPTASAEAYDAYLRGRAITGNILPSEQEATVAYFERAVELDPSFAAAWGWLARAHASMYWFYTDRSAARVAKARMAADRAAALAPDAGATHIARGYVSYWVDREYDRALQEFSAALADAPRDAAVHSALANVARRLGNWEQAIASRTRTLEIDPGNKGERSERGLTYYTVRRYDEAARDYEEAATPPSESAVAHIFLVSMALTRNGTLEAARAQVEAIAAGAEEFAEQSFHDPGALLPVWRQAGPHQAALLAARPSQRPDSRALHYLVAGLVLSSQGQPGAAGAFDSVRAIVEPASAARPDDDGFHAQLSYAYAGLGRCDDALREITRATELLPVSRDALTGPQRLQNQAEIEATCGRGEQAIDHLTALLAMPSFVTRPLLRADPVYAPLRANPRFQQLVQGN